MDGTLLFSTLADSVLVLAGHGYDFSGAPPSESAGSDESGIGTAPIVAALLLGVAAVGLVVWLNRREAEPGDDRGRALKLGSVVPFAILAVVIGTPLVVWTASSGGDEKRLMVERWTSIKGDPELLISLGEDDLNVLSTTKGKKSVGVECLGRSGQTVLVAKQKWPFIKERGYDYPHAHQAATSEQVRQADRCRLRGTAAGLAADVKGALKE